MNYIDNVHVNVLAEFVIHFPLMWSPAALSRSFAFDPQVVSLDPASVRPAVSACARLSMRGMSICVAPVWLVMPPIRGAAIAVYPMGWDTPSTDVNSTPEASRPEHRSDTPRDEMTCWTG
jgi:hypothetical protein